jgi:uncharacterized protein YoxC
VRWVVAVPVFICSVAVLVVSGFALYYALKASTQNVRARIATTSANIRRQLAETEQLIKKANQAVTQMQQNASTNASATRQSLTRAVTELQASVDQANRTPAESAQAQQEILAELSTISKQLETIERAEPKAAATTTTG